MHQAQELSNQYNTRLMDEAKDLTGLDNPKSAPQVKRWLLEHEVSRCRASTRKPCRS